ncbi:MAG: phosphate acyltransferase [Thermodesulfobacteriota bacterium]
MHSEFEKIIQAVDPCAQGKQLLISGQSDSAALSAVLEARNRKWIEPIVCGRTFTGMAHHMKLVSPEADITTARQEAFRLAQSQESALILDTGPLDADFFSLLSAINTDNSNKGILSYVSVLGAPKDGRLILLTDPLIHHPSGIHEKIAVTQNVIRAAHGLGIKRPKIAALSALELVNPAIPSTLEAAVLSKMSERGQFGTAVIEGPLAMDNAESASAAQHKGIHSPVPGDVDVYLFPDLESAQLTAGFLARVGRSSLAGILLGTSRPAVVRSPFEPPESWLINLAVALLI